MHTTNPLLKGHRQIAREFAAEIGAEDLLKEEVDDMQTVFNWNKAYKIDKDGTIAPIQIEKKCFFFT